MLHFFQPAWEIYKLTRDDPSAFAPPPAFGPFRVLHQVGVGALGPVFRTYEPTRDRLVAVKVFRLDVTPEQAQALADELSIAAEAGLFHPSVVEPIAAGVEGSVAYRAEEYVAAETLDVALRHYAPAPIDKVLPLITQLAGAIDFARSASVGHGALHPRDIFVTPEEARATGFGVVEALERVGLRAPVRRPYSAPERVAGSTWGTPADVFSLAAIAYELLTGRRPAGMGAQIGAVAGSTAGHHPGAIHAVFVQAMDEDPSRRFQTALAFASALDAAARGDASVAAGATAGLAGLTAIAVRDGIDDGVGGAAGSDQDAHRRGADDDEFDDVLAEKEDDEAHVALINEEAGADPELELAGGPLIMDDEAVEDLALDSAEARFADEFSAAAADLPAEEELTEPERGDAQAELDRAAYADAENERAGRAYAAAIAADRSAAGFDEQPAGSYGRQDAAAPVYRDRPRSSFLSHGVTAVLALLVGFAAGQGIRSPEPATAETEATSGAAAETSTPATAKPYSEETVGQTQPAPPAASVPPATSDTPPAPAAAEPAREIRATTGRVVVRSTPAGANVTIDGRWRGRTPLTLDEIPFGAHQIRIVQPGYGVAREDFSLSEATPSRTLSFRLQRTSPAAPARPAPSRPAPPAREAARPQPFTGSVYVDSRPRGARVLIDGKAMGTTPVLIPDIRIGSHVVRLQLADHSDWTTSTRVVAGQESRVTGSLERIR